jgi:hypothetical protein
LPVVSTVEATVGEVIRARKISRPYEAIGAPMGLGLRLADAAK